MKKIIVFGLLVVFLTSLGMENNKDLLTLFCGASINKGKIGKPQEDGVTLSLINNSLINFKTLTSDLNKQQENFFLADTSGSAFFCGVYDGHGGNFVSEYLQQNCHKRFLEHLINNNNQENAIKNSLLATLKDMETEALNKFKQSGGSTAVISYIKNNILYVAYVGDSRLVLEKNGNVLSFTRDHKPDNEDEKKRILAIKGCSIEPDFGKKYPMRTWPSSLNVTRTIGDLKNKLSANGQTIEYKDIIADPEYLEIELDKGNRFIIQATDGVWDVMSNKQAVDFVTEGLNNGKALDIIAKELIAEAMRLDVKGKVPEVSNDNISVVIVRLGW